MPITMETIKKTVGWFFIIGLMIPGLLACSQNKADGIPTTLPAKTAVTTSNEDFYQFKLEKEIGNGFVETVDWAPDGSTFALATSVQVDIYDAETLEIVSTLDTGQWNKEVAYSPDGKLLAIGGDDKTIQLWDLQSKEIVHSLTATGPEPYYGEYLSFSFSHDGKQLISFHYQTVYLWDISSGNMLESFPGHLDGIVSVAISPDGNTILAASSSRIFVRDVASRDLVYQPIEFRDDIAAIYFALDGSAFFTIHDKYQYDSTSSSANYDSTIRKWDLSTGEIPRSYPVGHDQIIATDINPEQQVFILGEETGFRIWDYSAYKETFSLPEQTGHLKSLALSPDGKKLITVGSDFGNGLTQIWDLTDKQVTKTFDRYSLPTFGFKLSPDGKLAAFTNRNQTIRIVDPSSGQTFYTLHGTQPLAFSPASESIAFTVGSEKLVLANARTGEQRPIPPIPCAAMTAVAFSPDGDTFAMGGRSCDLQIRDTQTGRLIKNLRQVPGNENLWFEHLSYSPDGKMLVLSGNRLKILDVQTGEALLDDDSGYRDQLMAFSRDGRYLALSGFGGYAEKEVIQVRDFASKQVVMNIRTLQEEITNLAYGSDNRTLMIVGESIELWDLWDGKPLIEVKLTESPPVGVALLPDGQSLVLLDNRGRLQRWSFRPDPKLAMSVQPTPTVLPTLTNTANIPEFELKQVSEAGKGYGSNVDYSPDGSIAALVENNGLRWFDAKSLQELGSLEVDEGAGGVLISPNNKIAVVSGYIGAQIVDLENKRAIGRVYGGNGSSFGYTFSKDSQYMAYTMGDYSTGGPYYSIGLWNVATQSDAFPEWGYFPTLLDNRYHTMSAPAISPDVKLVAAGHSDKRIYIWDLHTGETRLMLEGHAGEVNSVDFSPNGRWLASGSDDGTVRLWDPSNGRLVRVITGFKNDIWHIRFTANGQSLRVYLPEGDEYRVDLSSNQITDQPEPIDTPDPLEIQQYRQGFSTGSSSIFSEVLFSPDGKRLATASQNVLLWDVSTTKLLTFLNNPNGGLLRGMVFNPDSTQLAATTSDERVLVWDTNNGEVVFSQRSAFLTGASVYYGYGDSQWGPARSRSPVAEQGVTFSPNGKLLAFGNNNAIEVWDVNRNERVVELLNPSGYFATQVSYSTDGNRLYAIINRNRIAQIWDIPSKKLVRQIDLPDVNPNAFSAIALHGSLFARNNTDDQGNGRIEVWDLEKDQSISIPTDSATNEPLVYSSDGSLLAAFDGNSNMNIWNTATGGLVLKTGFDFYTGGIAISPDNKHLAVGHSGKASIFDFEPIVQLSKKPLSQVVIPQATSTPNFLAWPTPTPAPVTAHPPDTTSDSHVIESNNATQVREKARFGKGTIEDVVWSTSNDSILLTGSMGISEYVIDPSVGGLKDILNSEHDGWSYRTISLPDGRIRSVSTKFDRVYVRDVKTDKILVDLEGGGEPALSPDGSLLVYLNPDGKLEVWDIQNEKSLTILDSYSYYSLHPIFSPDGQFVAAVQSPGWRLKYADSIRIWNVRTGEIVNALSGPDNDITNVSFSADGKYMVGSAGGSAWVWDLRPGAIPDELELYQAELKDNLNIYARQVTAATLNPNNSILAVGTSEHTLRLHDRKTKNVLHELEGHSASIRKLSFSPNGQYLVSADQDGNLILWKISSGERLAVIKHGGPIAGMLYQLDGDLVAWGEGTTWEINPSEAQVLRTVHIESTGSILAASPAGDFLAVYEPFTVSILDARSGKFIQKLEGEAEDPFVEYQQEGTVFRQFYAARFSLDGSRLVTAGTGGVWYYDTATKRLIQQFPGNNAQKIAMSPDGKWILTSLYEQINPVSMYDLENGNTLFSLGDAGGSNHPQSVFSTDGHWVGTVQITWDGPYQLTIYDTIAKEEYKTLPLGEEIPLTSLAFSPNGNVLAVGRADGQILLIDLYKMEVVATLAEHQGAVEHLVFSPDGSYLISGSSDGTLRTWGLP